MAGAAKQSTISLHGVGLTFYFVLIYSLLVELSCFNLAVGNRAPDSCLLTLPFPTSGMERTSGQKEISWLEIKTV